MTDRPPSLYDHRYPIAGLLLASYLVSGGLYSLGVVSPIAAVLVPPAVPLGYTIATVHDAVSKEAGPNGE